MTLEERFEKVYANVPTTEIDKPICFLKINGKDNAFSWTDINCIIQYRIYSKNIRKKILERLVKLEVI